MSSRQHDPPRPSDSGHEEEEEVDSAATTLLASAVSSFEKERKDGDIELDRFEKERRDGDIELGRYDNRERVRSKGVDDAGDSAYNSGAEEDAPEDEHLLAHDTAALNTNPDAAETAQTIDGSQPPPPPPPKKDEKRQPVSWSSLPKKTQLAILTLARLSEPLSQTSLQAYLFYQLKSFHAPGTPAPSDAKVASQVGILAAAFTGAQFMTAIMWGRLADTETFGRKRVILIGLLGSCISLLGFGFSGSYVPAVLWRILGGMLNGNMGVMRTMISEMVQEKKYQSRAFLLLPMTFNIGVIIGPLLGGLLADPVGSFPGIFGPGGSIGGEEGVWWLMRWPYALPNVVSAVFLFGSATGVFFGLEETLESLRDRPDYGLRASRWVLRTIFRRGVKQDYAALSAMDEGDIEMRSADHPTKHHQRNPSLQRRKLPFRRIWTPNVLFVLLAHGLLAMHVGTFNALWFVFLSTPRYTPNATNNDGDSRTLHLPADYHPHAPFTFTGGLALPPRSIGSALAILGVIGISLQLLLYPRLSFRLGTITSFRYALALFPLAYCLTPFLAVIPSSNPAPGQASGALVWIAITLVLAVQVTARTFALPSTAILVNNASPHPSVLGTIHGIAQSVSSATRTVGPVLVSWVYGVGLNRGMVGLAWWTMAGMAVVGAVAAQWVREGDGHEIWLEGEKEEQRERGEG